MGKAAHRLCFIGRMTTRRRIKEHIRDSLKGETRAGKQVFIGQTGPSWVENLPVILVYTPTESISRYNESRKDYLKTLSVSIEIIEKGNNDEELDENLEEILDLVVRKLEQDETLGCLVDSIEQAGVEMQTESDGQSPTGAIVAQFNVMYLEDAIRGDECLDDFKGVDADWKIGHHDEDHDGVTDAIDEINPEQGES